MTIVLKRNCKVMLCLMALLACCFLVVGFIQQASADEKELLTPPEEYMALEISGEDDGEGSDALSVFSTVYPAPVYTAPEISSEGDGVIIFGNFGSTGAITDEIKDYASVITAVYLKDVTNGGNYEALPRRDWSTAESGSARKDGAYVYGSKLTVSYRQFQEELTNGTYHDYTVKIEAEGYEDLEVDLKVVSRAAQDVIVRVFASQDDANNGIVAYQKVLTLADLQALAQHEQKFTLYCGMTGMGASKAKGVYLTDLLDVAFGDTSHVFDSGDSMKFRVTDYLKDSNNNTKQKSAYDLALGNLEELNQNAWYGQTHTYETVFADRYYFPGMFAAFDKLLDEGTISVTVNPNTPNLNRSYAYGELLTEPLCLEGAVKVEPMLALQFGERVLDRSMAGSEQFPHFDGSLEQLADMGMNQNDRYRFTMGQMMASDANGNVTVSTQTTRFMITYNIFGIDIIKGEASTGQTPPALRVDASGDGIKVTYADAVQVGTTYPYYTNKITGVFVNGEELDDAQYDLSVGNLIIKDGVAPLGDCTVKITAEGYQDNEISFIVSAKIIGYEVYSDHDGEVYNQLDDDGNIVNQTDDQKFHVTVHFNGEISVTDIAALRNELEIKVNKTFTLVNANDPEADIYATRYGVVAAGADGKSLEFTLHIGFAPMSGHVAITAPNGLTTLKDSQDNPISWQDITFYMPNGVQLQTEEQIAARPEQNIQASVTKKVIAPADATRGMVHMLLLKNGRPVGTVNSFGANITTHYHDYLNLNAEKFAALIEGASSWYSGKFGADYPLTASGEELTITAVNSEEGDVIDLRIFAYPQDRDTQADKTALNVLIAEASSINGSSYTAATYNALQNELYIARSMADSIYYLQSEIDGEREALQTAIDSLQQSSSAPLVPTNLSAAAGNGQITLTWSAATGAASYNVYMGTAAGAYNTTPLATGITSTTYTATSLTNGTAYYFAVTAVNPAGESEKSEEASATPRTSSGGGSGGGSSTTKTSTVTVSSNKSGSATITAASLKTASSVKVTGDVELVLDASALKTIGVEKDLTVSVSKVDNNTLSADLQQKIGNRPVFDIDITSGGKAVTDLGQGELQITIPYTLGPSENAEQIVVYYIDANGQVQEMSGAYYDAEAKAVVFTTNHLSRYAIGYKKSSGFTDVPAGHWAADFISDLVEKGIINGRTETTFAPNDQITRAEFVKILAGIAGIDVTKYTTTSFSDVAATSWFAPYVSWAGQAGVSQGADGKFNPNAPITRQEMAAMIARFVEDVAGATLPLVNEAVTFADDDRIAGYAADAVTMMQKAGIINGKGNNQFAPLDNATRAEAAKMLASLMQILEK